MTLSYQHRALIYAAGAERAARDGIPVTDATIQVLNQEYDRLATLPHWSASQAAMEAITLTIRAVSARARQILGRPAAPPAAGQ
jgi:hypothetical protein